MTRTAEDAALLLDAMAGFDPRDSASADRPGENFAADLGLGVGEVRLGIPRSYFTGPLQPAVEAAWRAAIETLLGLGARPVEVSFANLDDAVDLGQTIVRPEMAVYHAAWYEQRPQDYSPDLRERIAEGRQRSAVDYIAAQRARERIRADLSSALEAADVLVLPCVAATATPIGADDDVLGALGAEMTRFTYPFNLSGFPSLALPCGFDGQGLPIGMQLAAGPWQERLLLRVGHAYQQATDWHLHRPPLAA
jgi:aspartyl-tRNA(Asn)/glutamyl-tRNA(Gln) amidotransferase subunit A